jgi:hypothetical protein
MAERIVRVPWNRILILRDRTAEVQNGLHLAKSAIEDLNRGTVVYAGEDSVCKPGDRVLFHPTEGLPIENVPLPDGTSGTLWQLEDPAISAFLGEGDVAGTE